MIDSSRLSAARAKCKQRGTAAPYKHSVKVDEDGNAPRSGAVPARLKAIAMSSLKSRNMNTVGCRLGADNHNGSTFGLGSQNCGEVHICLNNLQPEQCQLALSWRLRAHMLYFDVFSCDIIAPALASNLPQAAGLTPRPASVMWPTCHHEEVFQLRCA